MPAASHVQSTRSCAALTCSHAAAAAAACARAEMVSRIVAVLFAGKEEEVRTLFRAGVAPLLRRCPGLVNVRWGMGMPVACRGCSARRMRAGLGAGLHRSAPPGRAVASTGPRCCTHRVAPRRALPRPRARSQGAACHAAQDRVGEPVGGEVRRRAVVGWQRERGGCWACRKRLCVGQTAGTAAELLPACSRLPQPA